MDTDRRRVVRLVAAGGSALVALVYVLIGLGVITVIEDQAAASGAPVFVAAGMFAVLAALVVFAARKPVWIAGAVLQVLVIAGYLLISAERVPAFEAWGITVKILQAGLLAAFVFLAVQRSTGAGRRGAAPA